MESHDLDIVIDKMTGFEFAQHLANLLAKEVGQEIKIAKIASNPDRSKHLETATMKLFDTFVDFVNLRAEEYSDTSRIPIMVLLLN